MFKRILAVILCFALAATLVPPQAFAAETPEPPVAETAAETTAATAPISPETEPPAQTLAPETVPETQAPTLLPAVETEPPAETQEETAPEATVTEELADEAVAAGTCGDDLQWSFSSADGTLTITGTGEMKKYYSEEYVPWYYNRERITSVSLPEGLTYISQYAFWGCTNLTSITFPSTLEGIYKSAFAECDSLTSVVIPDKVRFLNEYAFAGCDSLETLSLGTGMVTVGERAFQMCQKLRQVNFGSVKYIMGWAFYECVSLQDIQLTQSVEYIYPGAFACCGVSELYIPGTVRDIQYSAFSGCGSLTYAEIENGVTSLPGQMFENCTQLLEVRIGSTVSKIADSTFDGCQSLQNIVVSQDNAAYASLEGVLYNKTKTTLVEYPQGRTGAYAIPGTVTKIGGKAFFQCTGLSGVSIPNSVQSIGYTAFLGCTGLTDIVIPGSVTEIARGAFTSCRNISSITLENGVLTIGNDVFLDCISLTDLVFPDSVTSLGESLFNGCTNLKSVTLSQNLTAIPRYLFTGSGLTRLTVPASVADIGNYAFDGCDGLEEVVFCEGLTSIGKGAFSGCDRLTAVILPDSVTSLGESAFTECGNLESVVLGGGLTAIGNYTFARCRKLKQIMIPASVTSIGTDAFRPFYGEESPLQEVYYGGSQEQWNAISVGTGNEALSSATIHFNYTPEGPAVLTELRYYARWDQSRQRVYFGERSSAVTSDTDAAFRADPEALLGSYVMATVISQWGMETLLSMKPVQTMTGIVSEADADCIVIDAVTYPMIPDADVPESYVGKYVLYHVFEGRLVGLEALSISDYVDNNAIVINGSGSAFAHYVTAPLQTVRYRIGGNEGTVRSDNKGIFSIPLGTFRIVTEHSVPVEILQLGDITYDPALELDATVTVTPFSFSEKWKLSMGAMVGVSANAGLPSEKVEATLGKASVGVGAGAAISVSQTHTAGKDSLELTSDFNGEVEAQIKLGPTVSTKEKSFSLASVSSKLSGSVTGSYGMKFEDYSSDNPAQQKAVAIFFLGEMIRVKNSSIIYHQLYNSIRDRIYEESGAVFETGSGAGLSGSAGGSLGTVKVNDKAVFSAGGVGLSVTASFDRKHNTLGEKERSASYQADGNLDALTVGLSGGDISLNPGSVLAADILGVDTTVTAKNSLDGDSLEVSYLGGEAVGLGTLFLGKNYTSVYHNLTIRDDILENLTRRSSAYRSYVNGTSDLLGVGDIAALAEFVSGNPQLIPYSEKTKQQILYSLPLSIGLGVGLEADLDLTFSYLESAEYESAAGYAVGDETLLTSQSNDYRDKVMQMHTGLPELIKQALDSILDEVAKFFETVYGIVRDGVRTVWAWIVGKPDSKYDRTVAITSGRGGGGGGGHGAWAISYSVDTQKTSSERTALPGGITGSTSADYALTKAATVGRPFVISVTDNKTDERVADFSDDPLNFTIRYAVEDLEAAGLSPQSAAVLDGEIAMYRYSDDGDYFEYIGGVNDLSAMTVTAEITRPGQYVLAVDSCAPAISVLDMSDFRETPTITAGIDDLSGLDVSQFVFKLDGEKKVDGANIAEHFDSETGIFTYAVTEALTEGQHTMSFTLADTTGNTETYEYSFNVDLTAPAVTDVTVIGATNEGSCVEIRASVSDENLTSVYALLSKKLPDGTWTGEVSTEMGNMGDGLWGLDYEGDGSTVKVRICATDVAENQTFSTVFEAKPYAEDIEVAQEYLALRVGQSQILTAEVKPSELTSSLTWKVEKGGENVISVDENGNVTAKAPGTAYILATATDGEKEITARCRIDVAESLKLDGVKLSTTQITTELYSKSYEKLDILLLLPQNYAARSENSGAEKLSAAISDAYFTDESIRNLFALNILDDRTVEIVPTDAAINGENIAKSYSGSITVNVEGIDYFTDNLTVNVKKSLPKLKIKVENFNSFYSGQSQQIQVSGATVASIEAEALPEWLSLSDNRLHLTADAPQKNASGKAALKIWTEEWAIPVNATVTVKNTYKAPGLKLSASSVQLSDQPGSSKGVELKLMPKNKKENLSDLKILGISAPEGYVIENYSDGTFTLKAESGFKPGKIELAVTFTNTEATVKLPITVKSTQVKLKLSKSSINLNAETGDSALIGIMTTPNDYVLSAPSFRLVDKAGNDKQDSGELEVRYEDGAVRVSTTDTTPVGANYTLYIKAGGSREVSLKIKTVGGPPSVTLKQSSNLDLSFPDQTATIQPSFKNYAGGRIKKFRYSITETKSGVDTTELFSLSEEKGVFYLTCMNATSVNEKGAYVLDLTLTLADGNEYDASLKLKIKRTAIKLKLTSAKLTLNKAVNDTAAVTVTCTTKGYEFTKPSWQLMDKTGKIGADGKLSISWVNGKLQISTNEATEFGATYKLLVFAEKGAAQTALTVTIPAEAKSNVTATLKGKGSLDVIRSGSVTVTPTYKNCSAETARTEELRIVRSDNAVVTDQFDIVQNADGSYKVSLAKDAEIDLTKKYQVQLVANMNGNAVNAKPANLSIKMGAAKLTAETEGTLFTSDRHSRVSLSFAPTDATLNEAVRVEFKDTKQAELFEILDYGNGEFAIGFRNGKPVQSAKPITLTLNVFLDGNTSAKPNATVKLKLSITP